MLPFRLSEFPMLQEQTSLTRSARSTRVAGFTAVPKERTMKKGTKKGLLLDRACATCGTIGKHIFCPGCFEHVRQPTRRFFVAEQERLMKLNQAKPSKRLKELFEVACSDVREGRRRAELEAAKTTDLAYQKG